MVDMKAAARKVFDAYDLDADGQITAKEYQQVVADLRGEHLTDEQAQQFIDVLDMDSDGTMSFEEFWAPMQGVAD
ncbi:calcium-binding protein [Streptomyces malaysiensis]|uniref:Calcium-binding protein n=2 Tax=Streptomyces malaysiensis TaxID=92644 RepID=A0A7X6B013_STRMQ|nr:EF-hand domain-containing protein [Streptomyces malaysiensis]NIY69069.1 calcium-binding protein [Streptomyces malaysiensis]